MLVQRLKKMRHEKMRISTAIAALAISSALLSYRNGNSNINITEQENVEFKKVCFGCYDFSQGKKVEGNQSYLDGAIQEANPLNYGKIYQYDTYLELVNPLNCSLGDSDF